MGSEPGRGEVGGGIIKYSASSSGLKLQGCTAVCTEWNNERDDRWWHGGAAGRGRDKVSSGTRKG